MVDVGTVGGRTSRAPVPEGQNPPADKAWLAAVIGARMSTSSPDQRERCGIFGTLSQWHRVASLGRRRDTGNLEAMESTISSEPLSRGDFPR